MNDSVIPVVSQHDHIAPHIVKQRLPVLLRDVSTPVQETSVNQQHDLFVCDHLSDFQEAVLKRNLQLHQCLLEHKRLLFCKH